MCVESNRTLPVCQPRIPDACCIAPFFLDISFSAHILMDYYRKCFVTVVKIKDDKVATLNSGWQLRDI